MNARLATWMPVVILGLGVAGISGMRPQYRVPPRRPIAAIPTQLAGEAGRDLPIAEEERRVAGMSDFVLREFVRDSTFLFSVYVGYYDRQVQGKTIHSPRNCLPGAGWEILSSSRVPLGADSDSRVNRVLLANKATRAMVYYWYQGRGRVEASEYRVKWNLLQDAARFGRTEEALVRIVVPVARTAAASDTSSFAAADATARRVALALRAEVDRVLPDAP